jgi:DNA-binding XRE family transcriptional regulator
MINKQGIDFAKVEMLRRNLLLSTTDMAKLFGVSRVTYYSWLRGASMRSTCVPKVKTALKQLLAVVEEHKWPTDDVIVMGPRERTKRFLDLLGQEQ